MDLEAQLANLLHEGRVIFTRHALEEMGRSLNQELVEILEQAAGKRAG